MRLMYRVYLAMAVVCCCGVMAFAAGVPNTLNYQGTLTSGTGAPVTATKPMLFKMYTSATGGNAFWTEQQSVNVKNGNFSVVFGSNASNAIPTAKFNGTTYIGVTVDPPASEMLPRQKLTSLAYALKAAEAVYATSALYAQTALNVSNAVPKGVIVMWSGAVSQIPAGWALCDGNNGTPNLKDRFIVSTGNIYPVGASSKPSTDFTLNLSHSHTINDHNHWVNGHVLTTDEMPSHTHAASIQGSRSNATDQDADGAFNNPKFGSLRVDGRFIGYTGSGWAHDHGFTGGANNRGTDLQLSATQDIRPPFYALAFIMKL